jgi:light-regulated signal transduction histidine kinase (bacteriophytochrome)
MAFGSLLEKEYGEKLTEEGRQYLHTMLNATQRMQTLIRDLLSYSRVSIKINEFVPVNMNEILHDVLSDLETRITETGANVEVKPLPVIDADPCQMRQLLQNLIGNSLKFHKDYTRPNVRIYAETPASEKVCRIVVEDDGIGFDEKYANRIFGLFQRLHQRDVYAGSGVGLAVCRRICERHEGTIIATSAPGKGARFVVTLPLKHT